MFVYDSRREAPGGGVGWLVSPREELVVYVTACAKADCDCTDVFLQAAPLAGDGALGDSVARLRVRPDGAGAGTGRADVVSELRKLPRSLSDEARERRDDLRHRATYRVPRAIMRSNDLVNWLDYDSRSGSIFTDGGDAYIPVDVAGTSYALDLAFCPRPGCDCRRALLRVMRIEEEGDTFNGWEGEAIPLDLDGQPRWDQFSGDRALAEAIHQEWLELGNAAAIVSSRYRAIKELGALSMPTRRARPARNAACPCGSGRKYKACCGRR